jgi:hypothetical protein
MPDGIQLSGRDAGYTPNRTPTPAPSESARSPTTRLTCAGRGDETDQTCQSPPGDNAEQSAEHGEYDRFFTELR